MSIVIKDQDLAAALSDALQAVKAGRKVIITSGNVPIAKLVPIERSVGDRKPGAMPELLSVPKEFYEPLSPDEVAFWE